MDETLIHCLTKEDAKSDVVLEMNFSGNICQVRIFIIPFTFIRLKLISDLS